MTLLLFFFPLSFLLNEPDLSQLRFPFLESSNEPDLSQKSACEAFVRDRWSEGCDVRPRLHHRDQDTSGGVALNEPRNIQGLTTPFIPLLVLFLRRSGLGSQRAIQRYQFLADPILQTITDFVDSGVPFNTELTQPSDTAVVEGDSEAVQMIKEILEVRHEN